MDKLQTNFESLLRPHFDFLYRIAYRFTGHQDDAQDLVQELLIKLYLRRDELQQVSNLRAWLVRVLYRLFLDQERKKKRSPLHLIQLSREDDHALDQIPADSPDPEQYAQGRILAQRIEQALMTLAKDQRAVLTLHDIEGYRLVELEVLLQVPLGTLKSRLHRARIELKKKLRLDGTISTPSTS